MTTSMAKDYCLSDYCIKVSEKIPGSAVFFVPKVLANLTAVVTMALMAHNGRAFSEAMKQLWRILV